MASKLSEFDFKGRGRASVYPWSEWADGSIWKADKGTDFEVKPSSFQGALYQFAKNNGYVSQSRIEGDSVVFQLISKRPGTQKEAFPASVDPTELSFRELKALALANGYTEGDLRGLTKVDVIDLVENGKQPVKDDIDVALEEEEAKQKAEPEQDPLPEDDELPSEDTAELAKQLGGGGLATLAAHLINAPVIEVKSAAQEKLVNMAVDYDGVEAVEKGIQKVESQKATMSPEFKAYVAELKQQVADRHAAERPKQSAEAAAAVMDESFDQPQPKKARRVVKKKVS